MTKWWFREAMREAIDEFAMIMNKSFDCIFRELKEIRREIKTIDGRADISDLRSRVAKLEQKKPVSNLPPSSSAAQE